METDHQTTEYTLTTDHTFSSALYTLGPINLQTHVSGMYQPAPRVTIEPGSLALPIFGFRNGGISTACGSPGQRKYTPQQ